MVERLIDANLDRIGEGLRVLEDIARFVLNDSELSKQFKTLRHNLLAGSCFAPQQLLAARNIAEDVSRDIEAVDEGQRSDLPTLVIANARRVQQSLRVMEEFAKLPPTPPTESPKFKQARFTLYELEQDLVARLARKDKAAQLAGVYLILDTQALQGRDEQEVARQAIHGGAKAIQLRDKQSDRGKILDAAQRLKAVCAGEGALFIINDWLDLALAVGADGVHLGQQDLPPTQARRLLPIGKLIGCSTTTLAEARRAQSEGADYIAVGSLYPTTSKEDTRPVGLATLTQIGQAVSVPVIAIGGINETNAAEVIRGGADGVAVINAILAAEDVESATRRLATKVEQARGEKLNV